MTETPKWKVDTIFLDAAGTLFRLRRPVGEIYGRWAARFGFLPGNDRRIWEQMNESFLCSFRKKGPLVFPGEAAHRISELERKWWRELVEDVFAPLGSFERMDEFFEAVYKVFETARVWRLEPGCQKMLQELQRREKKLAIISNFDSRLFPLLEDLQIAHFFHAVIISTQMSAAKPNAEIFRQALHITDSRPTRSLHVGDDWEEDFLGARRAGLHALLYDPENARRGSTCQIRHLTKLSSFLV